MTTELAMDYIPRRMQELGYGNEYHIRFRHFTIREDSAMEIEAYNQFFILVEENSDVNISSDTGIYDLAIGNTNEMQYEHQGFITITNNSNLITHVRFVQVIPN